MKKALLFTVVVLLAVAALPERKATGGTGKAETQTILPQDDWSFGAHPYMGPDYDSRPAMVTSVATEIEDLTVNRVRIRNNSSKSIAAVKLGWFLSREGDRKAVLLNGETPIIALSGGIPVGKDPVVKFPVASFARVAAPLVERSQLKGRFRMEVAVVAVQFEDGSAWGVGETPTFVKAARSANVQAGCPKQACAIDSGGQFYSCQASDFNQICTNCGRTCCNTICGQTPACQCNE